MMFFAKLCRNTASNSCNRVFNIHILNHTNQIVFSFHSLFSPNFNFFSSSTRDFIIIVLISKFLKNLVSQIKISVCPAGRFGRDCSLECSPEVLGHQISSCRGLTFCVRDPKGCSCLPGYEPPRCDTGGVLELMLYNHQMN